MCRYAMYGPYKDIYACFACRKVYKQTSSGEMPAGTYELLTHPCPQCSTPMKHMGHDFHAPKQTDVRQWRKVERLYEHGYAYHSCGCGGPGPRPAHLQDVDTFLKERRTFGSEGEALLSRWS
ncbi:hypothetical protein D1872_227510 [compost metagenome]